ncbi:Hypothetical predicted protein [Paramuricea clavata]|uniref:Uncharacterized protein n=1 Tax=Paramuricea clavata TaxID=317549 RepID=A0A7D9HZ74_PARCT|nr:Hypothetical predicted protein [Paramuricea clavata]
MFFFQIFDGPTSSSAAIYPTFVKLAEPVVTRYIRILPRKQSDPFHVMRLEVYGCLKEPMPSYFVPDDFSRRSYLLNNLTGDFYVCLYSDDRTKSSCQYTRDGYTWKKLSKRIVKVLALDSRNFAIYGLDRSNSYLRLSGNDWTVISLKQWERVQLSLTVILARDVPENLLRKDHIGGEIYESSNGYQWAVSHPGVNMKSPGGNWVLVATWKCCNH